MKERRLLLKSAAAEASRESSVAINAKLLTSWITEGLQARDGRRLKLRALKVGGRWTVTIEDLTAFMRAINTEPAEAESALACV